VGGAALTLLAADAWDGAKNGTWITVPICTPLSRCSERDART
jgi:hypothetical protein